MAEDTRELFVPGELHMYVAAVDATAPSDADSALGAGWSELGHNSENGFTLNPSVSTNPLRVHNSFYPARYVVTDRGMAVGVELAQWDEVTAALYLGGADVGGSGSDFTITPPDPALIDTRAFVFDGIDGDNIVRLYMPSGLVTETGQVSWNRANLALLPMTISPLVHGSDEPWEMFIHNAEFAAT